MTALLATLALALGAAADTPALPPRAEARYRVELGGEHVGWARLAVACREGGCRAAWQVELRAPAEAGGGVVARRVAIEAEPSGRARRVRIETAEGGRVVQRDGPAGSVPAALAELLLASAPEGERRCVRVTDEESGVAGDACARRSGPWLEGEVAGEPVRFRAAAGEAPQEVLLAGQRARFVADDAAALPRDAPRLYGVRVAAARGAERWCGRDRDVAVEGAWPDLPRRFPSGASCRERTARYLADAAGAGWRGRHAVGVAHDGRAPVWHEWAELWARDRWVAVDPSFEQAPAEGPRFTVARYEDGDAAARSAAGRAVLDCWQRGR